MKISAIILSLTLGGPAPEPHVIVAREVLAPQVMARVGAEDGRVLRVLRHCGAHDQATYYQTLLTEKMLALWGDYGRVTLWALEDAVSQKTDPVADLRGRACADYTKAVGEAMASLTSR